MPSTCAPDPSGPSELKQLAIDALTYLRAHQPTLCRLLRRIATDAQVRTETYLTAILYDELPIAALGLPDPARTKVAAGTCVECALADTHRHN